MLIKYITKSFRLLRACITQMYFEFNLYFSVVEWFPLSRIFDSTRRTLRYMIPSSKNSLEKRFLESDSFHCLLVPSKYE